MQDSKQETKMKSKKLEVLDSGDRTTSTMGMQDRKGREPETRIEDSN